MYRKYLKFEKLLNYLPLLKNLMYLMYLKLPTLLNYPQPLKNHWYLKYQMYLKS